MKFQEYDIPDDLLYTKEHEWAKPVKDTIRVGVTDFAAKSLNDVVYVSLPKIGTKVTQTVAFGTVESIKAVSELYAPFSGTVTGINSELEVHPELVNMSPYKDGWLMEIKATFYDEEKGKLLSADQYLELLKSISKK